MSVIDMIPGAIENAMSMKFERQCGISASIVNAIYDPMGLFCSSVTFSVGVPANESIAC
jgi:hypothetical protein